MKVTTFSIFFCCILFFFTFHSRQSQGDASTPFVCRGSRDKSVTSVTTAVTSTEGSTVNSTTTNHRRRRLCAPPAHLYLYVPISLRSLSNSGMLGCSLKPNTLVLVVGVTLSKRGSVSEWLVRTSGLVNRPQNIRPKPKTVPAMAPTGEIIVSGYRLHVCTEQARYSNVAAHDG